MPTSARLRYDAPFGASLTVNLTRERQLLGRNPPCEILLDEPGIPALMGIIVHSLGEYFLIADSDKHPFIVNGTPVLRKTLSDGDRLSFKQCELIFECIEAPDSPALPPLEAINPWALFSPKLDAVIPDELSRSLLEMTEAKHSIEAEPTALPPADVQNYDVIELQASELAAPADILPASIPWPEKAWGKLIPVHGAGTQDMELTASLALLDLGTGKATLSRRNGQCFATLVSGLVFCSKEKLSFKPKELCDNDLIASGGRVYLFRLGTVNK